MGNLYFGRAHTLKVLEFLFEPPIHTHIYRVLLDLQKGSDEEGEKAMGFLGKIFCGHQADLVIDLIMNLITNISLGRQLLKLKN